MSVRDQARYAVRGFVAALSVGVERAYWYNLVNSGTDPTKREHNFGLLRHPDDLRGAYTPKPAYVALAVLARQLKGVVFQGEEATPDPVYSYLFDGCGEDIRVMWVAARGRQAPSSKLNLRADGPVTVTNMVGRRVNVEGERGMISLMLSPSPIYVRGRVGDPGTSTHRVLGTLRRLFSLNHKR